MTYSTAEVNDKKWVQFICFLLTCCCHFSECVYTTLCVKIKVFLAVTKQLYECFIPSVRLSHLFHYVRIIMKFSGVIFIDRSDVHAKDHSQRSEVTVTRSKLNLAVSIWAITIVWIHVFQWNDAQSLMWPRRGALLFLRSSVKFQGHSGQKIANFDLNWAFPICNSSLNSLMAMKWCKKLEVASKRCPIVFQGHPSNFKVTWDKKRRFLPELRISRQ